jgi:hypoxanthine-DNA glycosylase
MTDFSKSFEPILGDAPQVLVLGTLPSKESLRKQEYYGHTRNLFWPIIYRVFNTTFDQEYIKRVDFAMLKGVAVWDVCHSAMRAGSLDADIKAEMPNDIEGLLSTHPTIKTIIFNGKKAEQLYDKYLDRKAGVTYCSCLSTSPANASYSVDEKILNWEGAFLSK